MAHLQWYSQTTEWVKKSVCFEVKKQVKTRVRAGFGPYEAVFGMGYIRNIRLTYYPPGTNSFWETHTPVCTTRAEVCATKHRNTEKIGTIAKAIRKWIGTPCVLPTSKKMFPNLLKNGDFRNGMQHWHVRSQPRTPGHSIAIVQADKFAQAVRIENPEAKIVGVEQRVKMSPGVYRLSARGRSVATHNNDIIFGGEVVLQLPLQRRNRLLWMSEYDRWLPRHLVFTNRIVGEARIWARMGYGKVGSTGEFTDIRLERICGGYSETKNQSIP